MSEMIERVARAICDSAEADNFDSLPPDAFIRGLYIQQARAAIAALREPTEEMLDAGGQMIYRREYAIDAWQTMIDAALAS